jgi:RecA-family ATPase
MVYCAARSNDTQQAAHLSRAESGVSLIIGRPKSGKSVLSMQIALAVASGRAVFDCYRVLHQGGVLVLAQDDPGSPGSVKDILCKCSMPLADLPFYLVPQVDFYFGIQLIEWLQKKITDCHLRLVILDSYTALRGHRKGGRDIEQDDLRMLDELAKRTGCAIVLLHHCSKGSAAMDWAQEGAGTYAMGATPEATIHISRFPDLADNAPERLVRVLGRHLSGTQFVLRFVKDSISYEHLMEGEESSVYPLIRDIQAGFGSQQFSAKDLCMHTGVSRATAHRQLGKLYRGGILTKKGNGDYIFS